MLQLILASASPRRSDLLTKAGFEFHVNTVKVSETLAKNLTLEAAIQAIARTKAEALLEQDKSLKSKEILVLSADTVVALGRQVLGKPKDQSEARQFLGLLSGQSHRVLTAICLVEPKQNRWVQAIDTTEVVFRTLSEDEISTYVASGEPMDKAGAYAIQGRGRDFVSRFEGSWSNVVGLPMELLERLLQQNGWVLCRRPTPSGS